MALTLILIFTVVLFLLSFFCAIQIGKKFSKGLGILYAIFILVVDAGADIFINLYVGFGLLILIDIITLKLLRK